MAKEFNIAKPEGKCFACGEDLPPGTPIVALVKAADEELVREDYHVACWTEPLDAAASTNVNVLGVWRTSIPQKEEKKKLLIDDALLVNFFERLEGQQDPSRVAFRYVLALILMRKKLLTYEGMTRRDGVEVWNMRQRGTDRTHQVVDPKLDEDRIAEVSTHLGDIMEGDFE